MKHKFLLAATLLLMLPMVAVAQNGVNYTYTHTDGVQYSCSVYTDSINITDVSLGTVTDVVIPDSIPYGGTMRPVREIATQSFAYSDVVSVEIPNTVTEIGYGAFDGCSSLETATIGAGVRIIWETAFANCGALTTLNYNAIQAAVFAFSGSGVLDDCDALTTINIGPEVTVLPEDLVGSVFPLVSLANVNIAADRLLTIASGYFGSSVGGLSITVPCSLLNTYQSNSVWSSLGTITADCGSSEPDTTIADTTHIVVYDTVHITIYDTLRTTIVDTNTVTIYDTVTRYIDTVYCDTLVIHDTIYLDPMEMNILEDSPIKVYLSQGHIVVEGMAIGESVSLYDIQGRLIGKAVAHDNKVWLDTPANGVYLLHVGQNPAKKIVVR